MILMLLKDVWLVLRLLSRGESFVVFSKQHLHKVKKLDVMDQIKLLAPWFHDIYIPDLDTTTFHICGIDRRVVFSQYQVLGFPSGIYDRLGLGQLEGRSILEIGPASGYYGLELSSKNQVTSIERADRFVNQASFLRDYFHRDNWKILKGEFPTMLPTDRYDIVICLGVLYHVKDHVSFIESLQKLSPDLIYLEALISKTGRTFQFRMNEGFLFSEDDFKTQVIKLFKEYSVESRVDLVNSSNYFYNQLDHYRSIIILERNR